MTFADKVKSPQLVQASFIQSQQYTLRTHGVAIAYVLASFLIISGKKVPSPQHTAAAALAYMFAAAKCWMFVVNSRVHDSNLCPFTAKAKKFLHTWYKAYSWGFEEPLELTTDVNPVA